LALSANRFSEKIMLKQEHEMMIRFNRIIIWLSTHYSRRDCAATTATSRKSMISSQIAMFFGISANDPPSLASGSTMRETKRPRAGHLARVLVNQAGTKHGGYGRTETCGTGHRLA
jgi:hypothetical protein